MDSTFKNWGYDIRNARIEFRDMALTIAETDCNTIRIDPDDWESAGFQGQGEMLSHELTHSAQFNILGRDAVMSRIARERVTNWDPYRVPDALTATKLSAVNPVDTRFTLEALATRAETAWHTGRIK